MKAYATHPLAQLRSRHAEIMDELEAAFPQAVKELRQLEVAIRRLEEGIGTTYSKMRSPADAVELCFSLHGAWMTKTQIANDLVQGGFPIEPDTVGMAVGDVLKVQTKPGKRFARMGDHFGLADWVGDKSITILQ